MALLPYDPANGEDIYDGTKDIKTPDNAYDPASTNQYMMEAADLADVRDYVEYTRQDTVIGNAKKIDGKDIDTSGIADGDVLQYELAADDWVSKPFELTAQDSIEFTPQTSDPSYIEGLFYYCADEDCFIGLNDESEVKQCLGREVFAKVYNDTGATITNGKAVYISGAFSGRPSIILAQGDTKSTSQLLGLATHDIEDSTYGYITVRGIVNDIDTSALTVGSLAYLSESTAGGLTTTEPTGSAFPSVLGTVLEAHATTGKIYVNPQSAQYAAELNNITGWSSRSAQTFSFTDGTRTLEITPDVTEYVYYQSGIQYRSTGDSIVLPDEEGLFFVYYNLGTLAYIKNPTDGEVDVAIRSYPLVGYVYWNATASQSEYVGFEMHGADGLYGMTTASHSYHHFTDGAKFVSGLGLSTLVVDGSGNSNLAAQFGVDSGVFADEDLPFFPAQVASTTGTGMFYFDSTDANLRTATETGYSVLTDTTAGLASPTGRLVYNDSTGGNYSLVTCADNSYVAYHTFALNENDATQEIKTFVGLTNEGTIQAVYDAITDDIATLRTLAPTVEFLWVASVIYQTRNSYSNAVKARVVSTPDGDDYVDGRTAGGGLGGSAGTAGTPGGASTNVQYNDAGAFNGDATFTFDNVTKTVEMTTVSPTSLILGGQTVSDVLVSADGASTSDSALLTPGWLDSNYDLSSYIAGPASAVDGNFAVFDTTTGKLLKDGGTPGTLAYLSSVDTAQIADDAITSAKLEDTTVTAGSYTATDITVDAQGRITAASSGSAGSGTTQGTDTNTYNIRAANEGTLPGNTRGEYSVDLQTQRTVATRVASGLSSTVSGGTQNTASGTSSTVSGGGANNASGASSSIIGGTSNTASGDFSQASGYGAVSSRYGERSQAGGIFAAFGDAQEGSMLLRAATTTTTADQELFVDGSSERFTLEDNDAYSCVIHIMTAQADGSTGRWRREVNITRQGTTTALDGIVLQVGTDYENANIGSPTISITADDTNDALAVKVTPANTTSTRWLAKIEYVKINY